ncbi:MAG: isoprenylcysteine carboxylmethyltransferase family protein [Prevotellaceae bacterium]|jgi:protein-S-isoprenylcysteine O-methyltransferase Ste14|nr:isoprenylcysteine carboxylmethyltransferase family protein [Prevotellaceae bacterium]
MALQEQFESQGNWLFRYRGILPIIILVAGIAVLVYSKTDPSNFFYNKTAQEVAWYNGACILICLIGLAIRVYTVGHTPANTSGRNTTEQVADSINQTGIYSIIRHPLYVGNFVMWLGIALATYNFWFVIVFALIYWIYYERIMFAEEQFLRRKFGETYIAWAAKTPAFIPNFKLYTTSRVSFSWKKALKQEKNGLVALFLVFSLFDVIGQVGRGGHDYNYILYGICATTLIMYCILRYLKRKTHVLNESGR